MAIRQDPADAGGSEGGSAPESRIGHIDARIGDLEFEDEFSDPTVEIGHERNTADHEIVTGHSVYRDQGVEFVVQALGRRPPEITITGWVTEDQLEIADGLVSESRVFVNTARWTGIAVPESVDTNYSRVYHDKHGWIFEVDVSLLGTAGS